MYALGTQQPEECSRIDAHLTQCNDCARRLADYRGVVGMLPLALPATPPPAAAWRAIQTAARPGRPRARRWQTVFYAARWPAVAAMLVAVVGWNIVVQRDVHWYARGARCEDLSGRP